MPVVYTSGPTYQLLRDALDRERQWSGTLAEQICRLTAERKALKEQLALADEMCSGVRVENEILRDMLDQHGINHAAIVTEE